MRVWVVSYWGAAAGPAGPGFMAPRRHTALGPSPVQGGILTATLSALSATS